MKTTLCTLYNSLYLDKGLVLYDSLKECAKDFELYVLCMDEKCFDVLSEIGEESLKPIHLANIEDGRMLEAKNNRSVAEYCWTCSSRLIQYIFETFNPDICTYIDADMYFYNDPQILVDEMLKENKSVMMVPHRFTDRNRHMADIVGLYCVEFNCFKNDKNGLEVLNHWLNNCLECCSNIGDGIHWGDQKYMDEWPILFPDSVCVCTNLGAGIAPWNIELYKDVNNVDKIIIYKQNEIEIPMIFYHFQSLKYLNRNEVDICLIKGDPSINYKMVDALYNPYLRKINEYKEKLSINYGINSLIKIHPSEKYKSVLINKIKSNFIVKSLLAMIRNQKPYIIRINE